MGKKKKVLPDMGNGDDGKEYGKSRSAKKRESTALQKLGENLAKLGPEARKGLPLTEDLMQALAFYDSLSEGEAARRQRQYIGKLMREADVPAIMEALKKLESPHAIQMARFHSAENWREKLLSTTETERMAEEFFETFRLKAEMAEKGDLIKLAQRCRLAGGSDPALKRNLFRQILALLEKAES